jgi:predicted membrane protein
MSEFDPHEFRDQLKDDIHRQIHRHRDRFHHRRHSGPGGIIVGTSVLLVGVLFLLENFGLVHVRRLWEYWPVILIAWGVATATSSRHGGRVWGGMIAIAGVILLLGNLHIIDQSIWRFIWPLFLIGVGLRILYRAARRRRRWGNGNPPDGPPPEGGPPTGGSPTGEPSADRGRRSEPGRLDEWAVFGGSRRRVDSQDFKGGETFAIFGGVELDLRSAIITQDEVVIDATALFGGVDIQVPENWNVAVEGHGIFGGYDDKTLHAMPEDARPRVVITGSAVFGGVVVKN